MDSKKLALLCRKLAENKKAERVAILDVRKISSVTDYFVIVSGGAQPHLRAIANEIQDKLRLDHHLRPHSVESDASAAWQVLDYLDVIVHVMRADLREKYDLESLWGDAPRVGEIRKRRAAPKSSLGAGKNELSGARSLAPRGKARR